MSDHEHHSDHETFEGADAGAALCYPLECESVKINSYMVFQGRPCKVVEYSKSKPGKIGHPKAFFVGIDIFNGKNVKSLFQFLIMLKFLILKELNGLLLLMMLKDI